MGDSIYRRLSAVEDYIPQLDAAQTDNAQALLRMIQDVADKHNELVRRLEERSGYKGDEDLIININEAMNDPV